MSLSIGIVGLPNVGKSTLFNALLKRQAALVANYPFATIEPNIGVVDVPDSRLNALAEVVKNEYGNKAGDREVPEKIIPAVLKFYDIAGLVKGAHSGEGLGNEFLGHIRETDAILHVVRDFNDSNIIRADSIDPESDAFTINTELILADLSVLEKKTRFLESELRGNKSKENLDKQRLYKTILEAFNQNKMANTLNFTEDEKFLIRDLNLLTLKPMIYILNVDESTQDTQVPDFCHNNSIKICAKLEQEISALDEADRKEFMQELGIDQSGLDKVIKMGYEILNLQTYLTAGPKEVRAWTFDKGSKAPQAAGKIHTDFEKGFISAEVCSFDDLVSAKSWKVAKEHGKVRMEGKNYVMKDGDVVEFHFSV